MLEKFKEHYQPSSGNTIASEELINEYKEKVPELLLEIWKTTGFGKYNNGLIEIIHPKEYESNLWTWLGTVKENYTPIAMTAFGGRMSLLRQLVTVTRYPVKSEGRGITAVSMTVGVGLLETFTTYIASRFVVEKKRS